MRKFSVGMPTFNDYDGVYFTTQALKVYHADWISEILVVDNNPPSPRLEQYCRSTGIRYIPFGEVKGPAGAKDRVIREAQSPRAVCIDSHVLLHPGFFEALDAAMTELGDHIYHGPLMYDWDHLCGDHMNNTWSGQMWGQWAQAWERDDVEPFSLWHGIPTNIRTMERITLPDGAPVLDLTKRGYRRPEKPFEIPAHGCGFFAVHRDTWLGFNPEFRGFGGEEWYIQGKYRKAGRKAYCVPGCKWRHRFNDLSGRTPEYPLTVFNKVRNYCLGHKELGLPIEPIQEHFKGRLTEKEWEMACGCQANKTVGGALFPTELTEFQGTEFTTPETAELVEVDTLNLGNRVHALGRWEPYAKRIVVQATDHQITPFLKARPQWFVLKRAAGWFVVSKVESDKPDLPGVATMGANAITALWRAGKEAVTKQKLPLVSDATAESRLDLCRTCPERRPGPLGDQCAKCGCFVDKKVWVATEKCPLDKWKAELTPASS